MSNIAMKRPSRFAALALLQRWYATAPISLHWSPTKTLSLSLDRANARIGQPLSPGSIAGVNRRVYRRTARRAYYGYGGAAAIGAAGTYSGDMAISMIIPPQRPPRATRRLGAPTRLSTTNNTSIASCELMMRVPASDNRPMKEHGRFTIRTQARSMVMGSDQ